MVLLSGWDIDLQVLSGNTEDAQVVEVPNSNLAYMVYGFDDISVSVTAGSLAVYRDKANPVLIFHPQDWLVVPDPYTIRCNDAETILIVYLANSRKMERYALVNLADSTFAYAFIPNALYRYSFRQLDDVHFLAEPPGQRDSPPYDRSYILDSSSLMWFEYHRDGEFDSMLIPKLQRNLLPRERPGSWQVLYHKIYTIALSVTSPTKAHVVTDRVMQQVEHYGTMEPPVDLWALVTDETMKLVEENSPQLGEEAMTEQSEKNPVVERTMEVAAQEFGERLDEAGREKIRTGIERNRANAAALAAYGLANGDEPGTVFRAYRGE